MSLLYTFLSIQNIIIIMKLKNKENTVCWLCIIKHFFFFMIVHVVLLDLFDREVKNKEYIK